MHTGPDAVHFLDDRRTWREHVNLAAVLAGAATDTAGTTAAAGHRVP